MHARGKLLKCIRLNMDNIGRPHTRASRQASANRLCTKAGLSYATPWDKENGWREAEQQFGLVSVL